MHCMELLDPFVSKFSLVLRGLPLLVSLLHFGVFWPLILLLIDIGVGN